MNVSTKILDSALGKPNTESTIEFKNISTDNLVSQFDDISMQGQLIQGAILIELSHRADNERVSFDEYLKKEGIKHRTLCVITQQHRNRLINLARFFTKDRPMTGISVTAGYEISAPKNEDVAEAVYKLALESHCSVEEIKNLIVSEKNKKAKKTGLSIKVESRQVVVMSEESKAVLDCLKGLGMNDDKEKMLIVLKTCSTKIMQDLEKSKQTKAIAN